MKGKAFVSLVGVGLLALLVGCGSGDADPDAEKSAKTVEPYADVSSVEAGTFLPDKPTTSLCNPCSSSLSCDGAGDKEPVCVDYGSVGSFCGTVCAADGDCPKADGGVKYVCKGVKSVEGTSVKQCVPELKPADKGLYGVCPCSAWAAAKAMSTMCGVDFNQGKETVSCPGSRFCTEAGLTDCKADDEPSTEICDAVDNDCDGELNEGTCDDNNKCTTDACKQSVGCVFTSIKANCDDGKPCTVKDSCRDGVCDGDTKDCDDGEDCTADSCDNKTGCQHKSDDAAKCEDGNACTVGDACKASKCASGAAKNCSDGNVCTEDLCHKKSGSCINSAEALPCDDGSKCTKVDKCDNGACKAGSKVSCDDAEGCTSDSCDAKKGCVNLPVAATPCDDGNKCNTEDSCLGGSCKPGKAVDCDDKNACTDDACSKDSGCKHANNTKPCQDGNPCLEGDACKDGKCAGGAKQKSCDDGKKCTKDSCDEKVQNGCVNLPLQVTGC